MTFDVFSRNGEILPISEATIPLSNVEYTYGFGVYENLRVSHGKILFIDDHAERLMHSAKIIDLKHPFTDKLMMASAKALVEKLPDGVFNLKVLLLGAREPANCQLIILALSPLFPEKKLYTQGASAISFHHERLFPQAKTLNMFGSYIAYRQAKEAGCYDALLINREGCITEGTRTNFFAMEGKVIHSPPAADVLEGVTRKYVLQIARENGYEIVEDEILLADLQDYEGAFLTSTSSKIVPLVKIDNLQFKTISEPLKELMKLFDDFLQKTNPL